MHSNTKESVQLSATQASVQPRKTSASPHGNRSRWQGGLLSLFLTAILALVCTSNLGAQTTATLSGTVEDPTGKAIVNAKVTLVNEATKESRSLQSNGTGLYVFPALVPGTYTVKAAVKGFKAKEETGIELHGGDNRTVPAFVLAVGSEEETVTVSASGEMIPVDNGQRNAVLATEDIENLALVGRDTSELLKILPGATTVSGGLTNNSSQFSDLNISLNESSIGNGVDINGAPNRGGTALLSDGVSVIDPGNMASSVATISPEMTQEVSVQAVNFGADGQFGPVVVSAISRSGSATYHGDVYFDARNNVLNANDWQDNHQGTKQGDASYYYPGGSLGGPVPYTKKKLLFWGGYERLQQNQGNANHLSSYIPTPEMMQGDFTMDNADNQALCPQGFFPNPNGSYPQGGWCSDLSGTVLPNGVTVTPGAAYGSNGGNNGAKIPTQFLDPGAAAMAKIWPKANANSATSSGNVNYYQAIPNVNNGWLYRVRGDYSLSDNTKFYVSYQQGFNSQLAQGNGAHIYWTPGNSIPFPGGGVTGQVFSKALSGHFVHTFSSSTTNEFIAAWAFGNFPFTVPSVSAAFKTTLGYPSSYGKVYNTSSVLIPSYSSAGNFSFPDFSQNDIFENPVGQYAVRKEVPSFSDTVTKILGAHTLKMGGFTQNTDNFQSTFSTYQNGDLNNIPGQNNNIVTGNLLGSPHNPVANFIMGVTNGYTENNSSPIADTAYKVVAFFADDTWKASKHLTVEFGARVEHVGHWYDRQKVGMAAFFPDRVLSDWNSGKYAPGFYWHGIDPGVPLGGMPDRLAFVSPRFGLSYDVFGTGNTVVRGGWGAYRFTTQVNDVSPPLVTAQHVLSYSLPGQKNVMLSQLSSLKATTCTMQCGSGSQSGMDASDYGVPLNYAYNLTIDQKLKWNIQLDAAYVGNSVKELFDNGETIEGSNFSALADQNKTPIGALFQPDPVTGVLSKNPQNVGTDPTTGASTGNKLADYHPFGYAYGTNAVYKDQNTGYGNYNGMQLALLKTTGRLTFDFNLTWSKALATSLQANPFDINRNYGPTAIDRPLVFNSSYSYQTGRIRQFNALLNNVLGNWVISGISTWQAGGYIPAALGNGVPNFSLGISYTGLPANAKAMGITSGLGAPAYFGTDASLPILPVLTCNPTSGLASHQRLNGNCFTAPAIGTQGGQKFPYMSAGAYYDNDLALYKTFNLHDRQKVQFRISAFDWMNHALWEYSSLTPLTLGYTADYSSKTITNNTNIAKFGVMDTKTQAPYQRILSLNVKYSF
jgi:hypothetical protein